MIAIAPPVKPRLQQLVAWTRGLPDWVVRPLALFVFTRVAIFGVTGMSLTLDPRLHRPGGPLALPALEGLCRWDCGWFHRIALDGYALPNYSNFFPLFPLLGRAVHELTGLPIPLALILISNLCGLLGLMAVYWVFQQESPEVATTGTALLAAWPFSFFHAAGYPESLMLASSAGAIALAYRRRHLAAGAVLGLGILARHLTVIAGVALLVAQLRERGWRPRNFILHRDFLGLVIPLAMVGVYFAYLGVRFDDPLLFWRARSAGWGDAAWHGIVTYFSSAGWEPQIHYYVVLSLIPGVGALLLLRKPAWWILAGYGVTLMVALWSIGLMGLGRYTQACWPAFLPLAVALEKRPGLKAPVLIAFALVQGLFLYLHVHSYPIN